MKALPFVSPLAGLAMGKPFGVNINKNNTRPRYAGPTPGYDMPTPGARPMVAGTAVPEAIPGGPSPLASRY